MRNSVVKADRYFSSLTVDQVEKLYEIYKYDFQMYGYEYESYIAGYYTSYSNVGV